MLITKLKSLAKRHPFKIKSSLSMRLFSYVCLCSVALIIIITLLQLLFDYQQETSKIEKTINQVESRFVQPLSASMWNLNKLEIEAQSKRILALPYLQYVKVQEIVGNSEVMMTQQGSIKESFDISKTFQLRYQGELVGTLFVASSLDQIHDDLLERSVLMFISQGFKTLFIALCLLTLIHYMVIRHINKIALYTRGIQLSSENKKLRLDDRNQGISDSSDELDELVYLLNKMQKRIVAELTDKEIAIAALQQERDFSTTVINASSTIICCLDANFNIDTINPAAVILTGYSQEELHHKNWVDIFVLEENKAELKEKLSANELLHSVEIEMHDQMGEINTLLWSFSAFYEGMDIKYLIGFGHDITEQKKVEQEILLLNDQLEEKVNTRTAALTSSNEQMRETVEQLKRMQQTLVESEKMASLGSLVAGIAHEIKTPISLSVHAATTLQEEVDKLTKNVAKGPLSDSYLDGFIGTLSESGKLLNNNLTRAADLINSFKQVAVDQSSEACYSFNLKDNIEQVVTSLKHKLRKHETQVFITCPDNLSIYSFPGSFVQVYSNLIINSMVHGFHEWQGDRDIFIAIELQDSNLVIDYRDTGKGITEEMSEHIFEPFVTSKRGSGGSGLGTHIMYNIISQLFKGEIKHIKSNQGAHFVMQIPYRASINA